VPGALDASLFGAWGALALAALVAPAGCAVFALLPLGGPAPAPAPAAAPAHVLVLLAAGASDSGAPGAPVPAWVGAGAVGLGGLWSRRLGPHRALWSWDVVEIAAIDLFGADVSADHAWATGAPLRGAHWGGAGLRLFRVGLAASHHHLSATGVATPAGAWEAPHGCAAPSLAVTALAWGAPRPPCAPLRSPAGKRGQGPGAWAPSEGALAAWTLALLAPSGGALAAWGVWLAPLYA
jgi:hypothetical protein